MHYKGETHEPAFYIPKANGHLGIAKLWGDIKWSMPIKQCRSALLDRCWPVRSQPGREISYILLDDKRVNPKAGELEKLALAMDAQTRKRSGEEASKKGANVE